MTTIGLSFDGSKTDKNGNTYFIITPNKDITPFIIDGSKLMCFKMNPNKKSDKSPEWILDSFVAKKQEPKENEMIGEEEIPF